METSSRDGKRQRIFIKESRQSGSIVTGNIKSEMMAISSGMLNTLHYNPVKHGLTKAPKLWPYATFHRYVHRGMCHVDWGANNEIAFSHDIGNE